MSADTILNGPSPDKTPQELDTSLPGREEEVINQQEQNRTLNNSGIDVTKEVNESKAVGEDQYSQGLGNNDTRGSGNPIDKAGSDRSRPGDEGNIP